MFGQLPLQIRMLLGVQPMVLNQLWQGVVYTQSSYGHMRLECWRLRAASAYSRFRARFVRGIFVSSAVQICSASSLARGCSQPAYLPRRYAM